jgi:hypothetical protein
MIDDWRLDCDHRCDVNNWSVMSHTYDMDDAERMSGI